MENKSIYRKKSLLDWSNRKSFVLISVSFTLFFVHGSSSLCAEQTIGDMLKNLRKNNTSSSDSKMQRQRSDLPTYSKPLESPKEHIDYGAVKPVRSHEMINSEKYGKDRVELEKITDKQIQELYRLAEKMKNSPNRGELWLRLAELYIEKADYIKSRRQLEYEEKLALYNQKKISNKPIINLSDAYEYNKKSIQLYEYFIRDFKNDRKMDQALYFLGFNYVDMGDVKKGAAYYSRLTSEYPRSIYISEASFSIGEYYFDEDQWQKALDSYQQVIRKKDSRLFGISLYKSAWCLHRMGQSKEGLKYLEVLIRVGKNPSASKVNIAKLDDEAKRDLVVFFGEGGEIEQAKSYFAKIFGDERGLKELEKLAVYLSDKGEKEKSTYLYKQLISLNRNSPKAYDYQFQIVNNYINVAKGDRFREELYVLVKEYGPHSKWRKENQENKAILDSSYKTGENFLKTYTLQHHQSAQASHGKTSQLAAAEGYKLYLSEFQDSPNYADMMFFYGELLYDMEKFGEAAQQYAWVAKNAPKSKYGPKAAMNMILGLEKNLPTEEQMQARVGQSTEPLSLDPRVKQFIDNGEWYLANFQNVEKNVELRFKIGRLYYLSNHFPEAEKIFKEVIQTAPKSKQAEYSANLLLDMYNLKKDYVGMEKVGTELLSKSEVAESSSASQIRNVLERASFKAGEELELKKDYLGAAKKFESFVKKYPRSNYALKAHFNSGVDYQKANQIWPALLAFEYVQKSREKEAGPLQDKIIKILPKMYQDLGMYQKAAGAYIIAADKNPDHKDSAGYYYNAAILYDALNVVDKANKYYEVFLKTARGPDRVDLYYKMADLSYKNGHYYKAIEYYQEFIRISRDPELLVEAHYNIADSYAKIRNMKESTIWRNKVVSIQKSLVPKLNGPGSHYAAQIRLQNVEQIFTQMKALRFPADSAQIKRVADQKLNYIDQINKELSEIIKYDSAEEIVGSLELLGRANAHMSEALLTAPLPPELNKNESSKQQYLAAVSDMAKPFTLKAAESFRGAINRARELESFNSKYFLAIEELKNVDSTFHDNLGEESISKTYQDWMGFK